MIRQADALLHALARTRPCGLFLALALVPAASGVLAAPNTGSADPKPEAEPRTIRIGIVESAEPGFYASTVEPTLRAIKATIPQARLSVVRLSSVTLLSEIELNRPDLFIAPAADFLRIEEAMGAHPIATRKSTLAASPAMSAGGAFVVRADRTDLTTLEDLKGKRAAATLPTAVDGWLAARLRIEDAGYDSERFFADVHFMSFGLPHVVSSVLSGAFDVGILPACMLERAEAGGLLAHGALRVVAALRDDRLACRHSTALFPDWVAGALPEVDPELARALTIALLTPAVRPDGAPPGYVWQVTTVFHAVRDLEKRLHLGQWSWTPDALWKRFRWYVLAAFLVLAAVILNEWRLRLLVRRRTAELVRALAERDRLEEAERAARLRLGELERMGAISQLCAMIAHELKQPVGSVLNYMAVLGLKLGLSGKDDPVLGRAVEGANREARRIAEIVDRVRAYAKRERRETGPVDLVEVLRAAVAGARGKERCEIRLEIAAPPDGPALVEGDRLELELLFLNLVKNAREAARAASDDKPDARRPLVLVRLETGPLAAREDPEGLLPSLDPEALRVRILDNGPRLTDQAFARLMSVSESVKAEGLGLGLAIVRNIVDEHGARLTIRRRPDTGLDVAVAFERCANEPKVPERRPNPTRYCKETPS